MGVRDVEKAESLRNRGIEVRYADYDNPESLEKAFLGIDRLLLISSDNAINGVQAAQKAQVKFIAYTSSADARSSKFILASPHRMVEEAILKTGIAYSFLRNNWYIENEEQSIHLAINGAPWVTPITSGKIGWASRQDFAQAAVNIMIGEGHENTIYELSGPLLTQQEFVNDLSNVLNKDIPLQLMDNRSYKSLLLDSGMPKESAHMYLEIQKGIQNAGLAIESNDFEKVLGRPLTPLKQTLEQILSDMTSSAKE